MSPATTRTRAVNVSSQISASSSAVRRRCNPCCAMRGPHQAVHHQIVIPAKQVAQHEPAHEPGRPGQQHFAQIGRGHRRGRRPIADGPADERPQAVHVPLTLRRQRAHQRRHLPVRCGCLRQVRSLVRPRGGTRITVDELMDAVESGHQFTVETTEFIYDIRVGKIPVFRKEVALPPMPSIQMRENRSVNDSILRSEIVPVLIVAHVGQNRCVHRNYFGSTQEPDGYLNPLS